MRKTDIIVGQFLGMGALILLSIFGATGAMLIPRPFLGILGIAPIYMGVRMWLDRASQIVDKDDFRGLRKFRITSATWTVAAIVLGNGADNLSIYIPVFARKGVGMQSVTVFIFLFFTGVWCYLAYLIAKRPRTGDWLMRYGHFVVPLILIALGAFILIGNGTFAYLVQWF